MHEIELLKHIRDNPRLMRQSYLDSSGATEIINRHTADVSFDRYKNKERIDYILGGCVDVVCPNCGINRVKVNNTYCSAKCVGQAKRESISIAQKNNAPDRMRKTKATLLSRYGVEHNNHIESCIVSRAIKREEWSINTRNSTFETYGLNRDDFLCPIKLQSILDSCYSYPEVAQRFFNGMPVMTVWRHITAQGVIANYKKSSSASERELYDIIQAIVPDAIANDRSIIKPQPGLDKANLELDIWVPSKKLGIEFHGLWCHVGDTAKRKHQYKYDFMNSIGCSLIQIYEDEWRDKRDIVIGIIRARLGDFDTIHQARKLTISTVDNRTARAFLDDNHMQGSINGHHIGLYDNLQLISMMTIGKTRFNNKEAEFELLRYVNRIGHSVTGGFGRLLSASLMYAGSKPILTYSDQRLFTGKIYERYGTFIRNLPAGYSWVDKSGMIRLNRFATQKNRLSKLIGDTFDPSLSEKKNLLEAGYEQIWDVGQKVYILG